MDESGTTETLSLVLFSGTDDKLTAATVLASGAAAMGQRVNVFLQYWALEAFMKDRLEKDHGVSPEAGIEGQEWMRKASEHRGYQHWSQTLRMAKEIGEVSIKACALSMDLFEITKDDLDPIVDGVEGIVSFVVAAEGGRILFI